MASTAPRTNALVAVAATSSIVHRSTSNPTPLGNISSANSLPQPCATSSTSRKLCAFCGSFVIFCPSLDLKPHRPPKTTSDSLHPLNPTANVYLRPSYLALGRLTLTRRHGIL